MSQRHGWNDQFGNACGVATGGPDEEGGIQASLEQLADEVLRLSSALAKASEERKDEDWRRMMAHIARELGDDEDRGAVDDDPHFYEQFDPWECVRLAAAALRAYRRSQFGALAARVVEESGNG